jgi:hypothetical protein
LKLILANHRLLATSADLSVLNLTKKAAINEGFSKNNSFNPALPLYVPTYDIKLIVSKKEQVVQSKNKLKLKFSLTVECREKLKKYE